MLFGRLWRRPPDFAVAVYEQAAPYMASDCPLNTISGMISHYENYEITEISTPKGENCRGEKYSEFYADEEKLYALILRMFYAPK
jgi:hypothetical protein